MQNEYKRIQQDCVNESVLAECSEEFILPDYLPEIRRVLRLETHLVKGECFTSGKRASFDGTVLYTLFYTDTEEKLTSVPLESRYSYELSLPTEMPLFLYSEENVEAVNMRPLGPRRVSIRTKLRARVHAVTEEVAEGPLGELLPEGCTVPEVIYKESRVLHRTHVQSESAEGVADWMLEGVSAESVRPLYGSADVLIERASAERGHVILRGVLAFRLMLEKEGEAITLSRRVPFEEALIADCKEGDLVSAWGCARSVELSLEEKGEGLSLSARAHYTLEALCERNEALSLLNDLYATTHTLTLKRRPVHMSELLGGVFGGYTAECDVTVNDGDSVPLASVSVKGAEVKTEGRRVVLSGELRADLLCFGGEADARVYRAEEALFPFRIESELPEEILPTDRIRYTLVPLGTEVVTDGERAHVSTELSLSLCALRDAEHAAAEGIVAEEKAARDMTVLTVVYPTDSDSLWSVGKTYGVSLRELLKKNGLSYDEELSPDSPKTLDGIAWMFV